MVDPRIKFEFVKATSKDGAEGLLCVDWIWRYVGLKDGSVQCYDDVSKPDEYRTLSPAVWLALSGGFTGDLPKESPPPAVEKSFADASEEFLDAMDDGLFDMTGFVPPETPALRIFPEPIKRKRTPRKKKPDQGHEDETS